MVRARIAMAWGLSAVLALAVPADAATPQYGVRVVKTYPHDTGAFTEGLFYADGSLFESTGLKGQSNIRQVTLETGKVVRQLDVDSRYFGEGIAPWKGRIISLTWQSGTGFVWNGTTFKLHSTFRYRGEGWGLTQDGKALIMSDGTPAIRFLDPISLKTVRTINVTLDGQPLDQINELEWVNGEILANIWRTRTIARINPLNGKVTGLIDLSSLPETAPSDDPDAVANGIAFDVTGKRLFITGKMWPHLYEVEWVRKP